MRFGTRRVRLAFSVLIIAALIVLLGFRIAPAVRVAAIALAVSYLLEPLVRKLERRVKRWLAVLLAFALVLLIIAGAACAIVIPAAMQLSQLPMYAQAATSRAQNIIDRALAALSEAGLNASDMGIPTGGGALSRAAASGVTKLLSGIGSFVSVLTGGMVVLALSYFYLLDWRRLSLRLALLVPTAWRGRCVRAVRCVRRELGMYMRGQLTIILTTAAMAFAALTLTGTPLPLAMGLLYGLLNAIPYFGPLIGTIPPVCAALAVGLRSALITLGALLLVQQIDNYIISPRVMGAVSGAGPALILLAISAGSALGGVLGMFLALPTLVSIRAAYRALTAADDIAA